MLPYLLILSLVMCWILLEKKAFNRKAFWFPLFVLSVFAGIRSWLVGTDSGTYTRRFRENLDIDSFQFEEGVEIGFQVLEHLLLSSIKNYSWLFLVTAIFVIYCYLNIIKKHSVNYSLSIFLYITTGLYTFFFNGLRQGIAMAIFTFAFPYLLEKKIIHYILICSIASLFHITALFMIPFYFIVNLNIKPIYKILATFLGSLIVSRFLLLYIASTNARYESYTESAENSGGLLTLTFYVFILIIMLFISRIYKFKDEKFKKLLTFYGSGIVFIIPLAMIGTNPSGPQRLITYFTWTLFLLVPIILKKINNVYVTNLMIIFFLFYFILVTSKFGDLIPYTINPIFEIF